MTSVRMEIIMQDFRMNTFLAVCQYMNYTHAADALHITQPAVSQHIRCLNYKHRILLYVNTIEECQEILNEQGCNVDENSIMEM